MLCYSFIAVLLMASLFNSGDAATFTTPASGSGSADVNEDAAVNDLVETIVATGGALGDYILVTQDVPFSLATTGALTVRTATLDFETTPTYQLKITVTDTVSGTTTTATATLTVSVQDINEDPSFAEDTYIVCVSDGSAVGTTVTTLSAVDPDAGATQEYSIAAAGNTDTDFTTSSDDLTVAKTINMTRTDAYSLTITVTDGSNTDTAIFNVTVASTCRASALAISFTTLLLGLVHALN